MIYLDDKKQTEEDLKPYVQELEKAFPHFFKNQSVQIVFNQLLKAEKRVKGSNGPGNAVSVAPKAENIPTIYSQVGVNGIRKFAVYTEELVSSKEGVMQYGKPKTNIYHGMNLNYPQDLEKLIVFYNFDERFSNSKVGKPSSYLSFVMPDKDAANRIQKAKDRAKYERDILFSDTGISYDRVKGILKSLRMFVNDDENLDRTSLYDFVMTNDQNKNTYETLVSQSDGGKLKDALAVVNDAIAKSAVVQHEGNWVPVGKTGPGQKIVEVSGTDPVNDFAAFLAGNPDAMKRVELAVKKASEVE